MSRVCVKGCEPLSNVSQSDSLPQTAASFLSLARGTLHPGSAT